jgi:hypothetical protein
MVMCLMPYTASRLRVRDPVHPCHIEGGSGSLVYTFAWAGQVFRAQPLWRLSDPPSTRTKRLGSKWWWHSTSSAVNSFTAASYSEVGLERKASTTGRRVCFSAQLPEAGRFDRYQVRRSCPDMVRDCVFHARAVHQAATKHLEDCESILLTSDEVDGWVDP